MQVGEHTVPFRALCQFLLLRVPCVEVCVGAVEVAPQGRLQNLQAAWQHVGWLWEAWVWLLLKPREYLSPRPPKSLDFQTGDNLVALPLFFWHA
jgi:hypothetical protein